MYYFNLKSVVMALVGTLLLFSGSQAKKDSGKPWIGIYMQDVTQEVAESFDLDIDKGVLVSDVMDDSPADKAGIKRGDVIISWNSQNLTDSDMLTELVSASKVGDNVSLEVLRKGAKQKFAVEIGDRPKSRVFSFAPGEGEGERFHSFFANPRSTGIGVSMQPLSGDLGEYFGIPDGDGALITEVMDDTPAEKAGLKAGDVIVKVDGDKVETPSHVSELILDKEKGDKVQLVVVRNKAEQTITVEVDEIESLGSVDWVPFPGEEGLRYLERMPRAPRTMIFDERIPMDDDKLQRQMEALEERLVEMQRKLDSLEKKIK